MGNERADGAAREDSGNRREFDRSIFGAQSDWGIFPSSRETHRSADPASPVIPRIS